jgi:Fungal specific transcription factor domain
MYGLAIRSAQSIGLHRDGTNFNLSPFDTEMRRRIWWQIVGNDGRASEDHGIAVSNLDLHSDTRFSLNISDPALDPAMAELPAPNSGWTEMTFPLIMTETGYTMQWLYKMLPGFRSSSTPPSEARRKEVIAKNLQHVENLLSNCNPVIPIQRATIIMSRMILRKLEFVSRQQWQSVAEGRAGQARHATEENLVDACEILELKLKLQTDEQLRNYRWAGEAYPEYHVIMYVLWHLCVKPTAGSVERAWAAVDSAFELENNRRLRQESASGSKWAALAMLRDKAMRIRDSGGRAQTATTFSEAANGRDVVDNDTQALGCIPHDAMGDTVAWDGRLLDWNNFLDDLSSKDYNFEAA